MIFVSFFISINMLVVIFSLFSVKQYKNGFEILKIKRTIDVCMYVWVISVWWRFKLNERTFRSQHKKCIHNLWTTFLFTSLPLCSCFFFSLLFRYSFYSWFFASSFNPLIHYLYIPLCWSSDTFCWPNSSICWCRMPNRSVYRWPPFSLRNEWCPMVDQFWRWAHYCWLTTTNTLRFDPPAVSTIHTSASTWCVCSNLRLHGYSANENEGCN